MSQERKHFYGFGPFRLDAQERLLTCDGKPVPLAPKAFEALLLLVQKAGHLVDKDELMRQLWPGTFVEEGNLTKHVSLLRKILAEPANGQEYIETVPKRGYRFCAEVRESYAEPGGRTPELMTPPSADSEAGARATPSHGSLAVMPSPRPSLVAGYQAAPDMPADSVAAVSDRRPAVGTPPLQRDRRPAVGTPPLQRAPRWPWLLAGAAVLVGCGLYAWLSSPPSPTVSRTVQLTDFGRVDAVSPLVTDGTRLYFVERRGGRHSLAQVSVKGGEPVPVPTPFPNTALYGISPDHSELLVGSDTGGDSEQRLWILPTTGGPPHRLGDVTGHDPAWSPDGQRIGYFSGSDLYVVKPDGSDSRKLVTAAGGPFYTRWSPDGQVVRFSVWGSPMPTLSLWEVSAEGRNLHRLLAGWRESPTIFGDGESGGDWTPDGKYFVFRSVRAGLTGLWAIREQGDLWRRRPRAPVLLTTTDSRVWNVLPANNGKRIFFTGDKEVRELARYDARLKQFVPYLSGVRAREASFSRDGRQVAYIATTNQESILWRSEADGSDRLQLTFPPLAAYEPRWSPDGKQVAFEASVPGKPTRIFLVSPEGGEPEPVTAMDSFYPDWSPDGVSLLFTRVSPPQDQAACEVSIWRLDLNTRRLSVFPGSEGLLASASSPDGRYVAAVTHDDRKLMLFDFQSHQWSELASGAVLVDGRWSRDSKYVYSQDGQGEGQPIFRVRISDHRIERIATSEQILRADVRSYTLAGLAPDNSPLVSLMLSHADIYALDVNFP